MDDPSDAFSKELEGVSLGKEAPMSSYEEKTVWITGASSGIGESLALELAKRGATLVLTARRSALLEELRSRCPDPDRVHVLCGDLLDESSWAPLAREAEAVGGPIDVLVNNAGVTQRAMAQDTLLADVRRLMELNFFAPIALTNAVLPSMLARDTGRIVVVSSVAGYVGTPLRSSYAASKHAVRGYFDSLRAELHDTGVGVTIVCPGYIRTEISTHAISSDGQVHGKSDEGIASGMDPKECAGAIADAVAKGRSEVYVGGKEVYGIYLKRFFPKLVERVVPKHAPE